MIFVLVSVRKPSVHPGYSQEQLSKQIPSTKGRDLSQEVLWGHTLLRGVFGGRFEIDHRVIMGEAILPFLVLLYAVRIGGRGPSVSPTTAMENMQFREEAHLAS